MRTARSLGELQQRLETIDRAQTKIEKLSGDVLGLQDILSNKQTRGAFGEIQLREIVTRALPPDVVTFQATLSTGRARRLPDRPAAAAGADRHRRQVPARGLRGAARGEDAAGGAGGAAADARRGPGAHAGDRREVRDRGRDRRRGADVPALGGGLCRAARQLRRPGARGLRPPGLDRLADHLHGDAAHAARRPEGRAPARRGARDPPRARAALPRRRAAVGAGRQPRPPLRPGAEGHRGDPHLRRQGAGPRAAARGDRLRAGERDEAEAVATPCPGGQPAE